MALVGLNAKVMAAISEKGKNKDIYLPFLASRGRKFIGSSWP